MVDINKNNNLQPQQKTRTRKGTGFTNINKYIGASKDNKLGSAISSGIKKKSSNVRTGLGTQQSKFQNLAQEGRLGRDDQKQAKEKTLSKFEGMSGAKFGDEQQTESLRERAQSGAGSTAIQGQQKTREDNMTQLQSQLEQEKAAQQVSEQEWKQQNPAVNNSQSYQQYTTDFQAKQKAEQDRLQGEITKAKAATEEQSLDRAYTQNADAGFSGFESRGARDWEGVTDDETKQFERFRSGEYLGPRELDREKFAQIYGQANEAEQLGQATRTAGGRESLLSRFASQAGSDYSAGERKLDTMLLGETGANELRQARRETSDLLQASEEAQQTAMNAADEYTKEAQAFGKDTEQQLAEMTEQRDDWLTLQRQKFEEDASGRRQDILTKIEAEDYEGITPEDVQYLNLNEHEKAQLMFVMEVSNQSYISSAKISGQQFGFGNQWGTPARKAFDSAVTSRASSYAQQQQQYKDQLEAQGELDIMRLIAPERFYTTDRRGRVQEGTDTGALGRYALKPDGTIVRQQTETYGRRGRESREVETPITEEELIRELGPEKAVAFKAMQEKLNAQDEGALSALANRDVGRTQKMQDGGRYRPDYALWGEYDTALKNRQVQGTITGDEIANAFRDYKAGQGLSAEHLAQLGMTSGNVASLGRSNRGNFEFEKYLSDIDRASMSKEGVASGAQLAQMNALRQLAGSGQEFMVDEAQGRTAKFGSDWNKDATQDAMDKYFGKGNISVDPLTGQVTAKDDYTYNALKSMQHIGQNPLAMLGTGGMSAVTGEALALGAQVLDQTPLGDLTTELGQIGGDFNPLKLNADAWKLGDKALSGFTSSAGRYVSDLASKLVSTVICGELHRQGIMSDELYAKDCEFSIKYQQEFPEVYQGYHIWAKHVAKGMSKSKILTKIITPFGLAWANHMAGNKTILGKVIFNVGVPICGAIGKVMRLFKTKQEVL
jgi:hypothetical protein